MKFARSICREKFVRSLSLIICLTVLNSLQAFSSTLKAGPVSASAAMQQTDPSVVGTWSEFATWNIVPVHISLMPDGRVLFWSRDKTADGNNAVGKTNAYVWNPNSTSIWNPTLGTRTLFSNNTTNLFCTGHSFLPDGRLLITGGHADPVYDAIGEKHTNIFNFNNSTNPWSKGPDMNNGRWYPFNVTLGSGEPLVVSGSYWDGTYQGSVPKRPSIPSPKYLAVWYTGVTCPSSLRMCLITRGCTLYAMAKCLYPALNAKAICSIQTRVYGSLALFPTTFITSAGRR